MLNDVKIAILTSSNQWFVPYAKELSNRLINSSLFFNYKDIDDNFDIVFILSYHKIIEKEYLKKSKHNIVIHASALPKGKGWAPLFWQILEGKKKIPFSMFEATNGIDNGDIYMQKILSLTGYELNEELRDKQAQFTIKMCLEFITNYEKYKLPYKQNGDETFYKKRTIKDSKLNIDKTIKEQFNPLRIVNNDEYPAFFEIDGNRYILKIELDERGGVELIDFVDTSPKEKELVLDMRNHENVKFWMYNSDNIVLDTHLRFINSLIFDIKNQYFLVKKDEKCIGVVNFMEIDFVTNKCEFGLYANPFEKIAGVGRILEEICIKYAFDILNLKTFKLEVFSENIRAIKLYNKFKFKESARKVINNKKVICMELKNENR